MVRYFGQGGSMAAWPINPFRAKASEESPLEVGPPYSSRPDCEYCEHLEAALEEMNKDNAGR